MLHRINPHIHLEALEETFSTQNAISLIARHDLVLDCTDNVMARYLISDAAVMNGVQVVSGAGQGLEGQLVVLHKDLEPGCSASGYSQSQRKEKAIKDHKSRGPCYRCLFPRAPRPEDVADCEDGGVLGCVTGLVGTMQATEAIKLLVGMSEEGESNMSDTLFGSFRFSEIEETRRRATSYDSSIALQLSTFSNGENSIAKNGNLSSLW